jgi:26S proteasome regulatory subunit N12
VIERINIHLKISGIIPESAKKWEIIGLYLLNLLTSNRIGDFHTELEMLPVEYFENEFIKYSIRLEQELMEGSYNQLWSASARIPSPLYQRFVDTLVETVRERILDCCAKSYAKLSLTDATQLLNLSNTNDAAKFATAHGWEIQGSNMFFKKEAVDHLEIPAHKVIAQVLSYASELERII